MSYSHLHGELLAEPPCILIPVSLTLYWEGYRDAYKLTTSPLMGP